MFNEISGTFMRKIALNFAKNDLIVANNSLKIKTKYTRRRSWKSTHNLSITRLTAWNDRRALF